MFPCLLALSVVLPFSLALSTTSPVIVWSPSQSQVLDTFTRSSDSSDILESLLTQDSICQHNLILLVEHPGLHASDLRSSLHPECRLAQSLRHSPSSHQFPYARRSEERSIVDLAAALALHCDATLTSGVQSFKKSSSRKQVIHEELPFLFGSGDSRKATLSDHEKRLSNAVEVVTADFPNALVIYAGRSSSLLHRDMPLSTWAGLKGNTTSPTGGILKRYQLLTPGLITTLLIVIFVILPVIMIGVNALASIQSPLSTSGDIPKGFDAQQKKMQ